MKIVLAPNAFKGSLAAAQVAAAMARGARRALPGCVTAEVPVADGGDGLHQVALEALGAREVPVVASGPRGDQVQAVLAHEASRGLAVVEMALASGLALLPDSRRDPLLTTTAGTGQLMAAALDLGVSRLVVGIGGSATNDGGIGMATALGGRFLDAAGQPVEPVGGQLEHIVSIDLSSLDPRLAHTRIDVVCDVDNPLCGPRGAAHVYGPQKGASPEAVRRLDAGLANLAAVIERDLGLHVLDLPGAGAAGGLGAGLHAFVGGKLRRGTDVVFDIVGLDEQLTGADLVLTGEGQIDFQTRMGKAPAAVAERARARGIPCLALAGGVGSRIDELHQIGLDAVVSICSGPMTLETAMHDAALLVEKAAEQLIRSFLAGRHSVSPAVPESGP